MRNNNPSIFQTSGVILGTNLTFLADLKWQSGAIKFFCKIRLVMKKLDALLLCYEGSVSSKIMIYLCDSKV
jgi:hypothetical protein